MFGYILLALFLMAGVALTDAVFYRQDRVVRLWLGLCAGLILMMWLPTLYAFFLRFTRAVQLLGLGTAIALAALAQILTRDRRREARWTDMPPWLMPALVLPLIALGGYLQYTHTLRVIDGGLWVGQSTRSERAHV